MKSEYARAIFSSPLEDFGGNELRFYILVSAFLFSTSVGSSQSGWRMIGHDASRTNRVPAIGPSALPSFQPLIQEISGTLRLIGPDGSLVFFNGSPSGGTLSSYSSTGTPKWVQAIALNDVAMMPNGTVVVSSITSHSVTALDKDTGRPIWPQPFTNGIDGNETAGLAIDSSGIIYVVTGASYVGVPETLTAINPYGTVKWQNSQRGRGGVGPLLSNDESTVYIPFGGGVEALSAATGAQIGGAVFNVQLAAPWGPVYSTPNGSFSLFGLWECTLSGCNQITSADVQGVATVVPPNTLIAVTNISPGLSRLQGIDRRTGNALWTATEDLNYMIADANGTVYAVDLQTNDLVALNGLTGSQLWRQHFDYPTFALSPPLLGDDGSLYVTAGATLYKSGPGANCTPPRFIFTDATGAAGFADIGVSNQRLDQGELKGDVRIENDLHVWLGVASIAADPGDSARLVPNLNAGVEGVAATFGLVPPCTGISLHTSCPNPGSAGWTSSFCSRGVVEIHTQLTVASAALTLTDILLAKLTDGVVSISTAVSIEDQFYTRVPEFKSAADCLAKPSAGTAICLAVSFLTLMRDGQARGTMLSILESFGVKVGVAKLVSGLAGASAGAIQAAGDLIAFDIGTGQIGHLGVNVLKLDGQ